VATNSTRKRHLTSACTRRGAATALLSAESWISLPAVSMSSEPRHAGDARALDGNVSQSPSLRSCPISMQTHPYVALLALLALHACGQPTGPGIDGPLMFAALIDDSPWQPDSQFRLALLRPGDSRFYIQGAERIDSLTDIRIVLSGRFRGLGPYALGGETSENVAAYFAADGHYYLSSQDNPGQITFTAFDTVTQIVAGRFAFLGVRPYDGGTLRVTEGRFRLRYTFRPVTPRLPSNHRMKLSKPSPPPALGLAQSGWALQLMRGR